jgi:hypothetical protein
VNVVIDLSTGRAMNFRFVEMRTDEAAKAASAALNGREVNGRQLRVNDSPMVELDIIPTTREAAKRVVTTATVPAAALPIRLVRCSFRVLLFSGCLALGHADSALLPENDPRYKLDGHLELFVGRYGRYASVLRGEVRGGIAGREVIAQRKWASTWSISSVSAHSPRFRS